MTWRELLEAGEKELSAAGIQDAGLDAWYLFEQAFGLSRAHYLLLMAEQAGREGRMRSAGADFDRQCAEYRTYLSRRSRREPLQHILGTQEFMGLEFYVNRHVLIPRQDTETLVETVLAGHREQKTRILDMCTGSGCIAVSLAVLGGYLEIEAAELSEAALEVAKENAGRYGGRCKGLHFRKSDLFSAFSPEERFDVIVSNPPYIPSAVIEELEPEVRDFEPRAALDGEKDGLSFYRRLAAECPGHLADGGQIYFEIGCEQGEAVRKLLLDGGFCRVSVLQDLTGKDRVVCGVWRAAGDEEVLYV